MLYYSDKTKQMLGEFMQSLDTKNLLEHPSLRLFLYGVHVDYSSGELTFLWN